jgi:hypothetical protein
MMYADPRNTHRGGEGRVESHRLGVTPIAMRMRLFQFGPVLDEIRATHRLFSLVTKNDDSGLQRERTTHDPRAVAFNA